MKHKLTLNEYDSTHNYGVTLEINTALGAVSFRVNVDGNELAAYIGPSDIKLLIEHLTATKSLPILTEGFTVS